MIVPMSLLTQSPIQRNAFLFGPSLRKGKEESSAFPHVFHRRRIHFCAWRFPRSSNCVSAAPIPARFGRPSPPAFAPATAYVLWVALENAGCIVAVYPLWVLEVDSPR
ncbi:hypothetical protein DFH07DRAFT_780941 [Mycena maculata]|uniref:Uncharacterized protein n=1 Tax=Mycena maculata TaxID=230809 RepID=A0AAD7I187_9AGAR|nr:hypothetical protein DFH07DRAFT_780941 [Mycena maculata]